MPFTQAHPQRGSETGAAASLEGVFQAEEGALVRFAYGLVGRRDIAEELVQEGFIRLHRHWSEVENPRAWIFRAVRNLAISHLRGQGRETPLTEDGEGASDEKPRPDEQLGRLEAVGMVRLLVNELRDTDRQLVLLKYVDGLSYKEIGEKTGLSVGNVGYRLHHLLKGLAASLRQAGVTGSAG